MIALGYHTIHEFDRGLERRRDTTHGLMVGLHEAALTKEGRLWVAATAIDRALEYDMRTGSLTRQFSPRDDTALQSAFDLEPLDIDTSSDNRALWLEHGSKADPSHLHLNAVAVAGNRVLALFNRFGAIVDLTEQRVLVRDDALERGHNLVVLPDGTLVSNDTHGRTIRFYDAAKGELVQIVDLMAFPWVRGLRRAARQTEHQVAKPLFVRGMAFFGRHIYVGVSPASILCIDWRTSALEDVYEHSDDIRTAIHGLAITPDA